jgi:hypothetical protein
MGNEEGNNDCSDSPAKNKKLKMSEKVATVKPEVKEEVLSLYELQNVAPLPRNTEPIYYLEVSFMFSYIFKCFDLVFCACYA